MPAVYAHTLRGDKGPFYFGSGLPSRPRDFARGVDWCRHLTGKLGPDYLMKLDQIEVTLVREYLCEGQMRFDECMLAAEHNTLGNRVGAARASVDMLTGLKKGGRPCACGLPACRRRVWLDMTHEAQDSQMRRQL